jgi:hypothetical protein
VLKKRGRDARFAAVVSYTIAALARAVQLRSIVILAGKLYVYILVTYDMQAQL